RRLTMPVPRPDARNVPAGRHDMTIDWKFIGTLEGAGILKGYVPVSKTSNSGVTIATGVDLGQASEQQIDNWAIDDSLKTKLKPYCGLKKQDAVDFLHA